MGFSLPSNPTTNIELPDIKGLSVNFVYNFFVPDEKTNDTGDIPDRLKQILAQPTEGLDISQLNKISRRIPRFVEINFTRARNPINESNENISYNTEETSTNSTFIKNNIDKIIFEELFLQNKFIRVDFQDNNIDRKLYNFVSGSIERKIASNNEIVIQDIQEQKTNLFDKLTRTSPVLEKARTLRQFDAEAQKNDLILNVLTNIKNLGARYVNEAEQKEKTLSLFDEIKNVRFGSQINKKIFGTVAKSIVSNPMSIYADEFASLMEPAQSIEQNAVSSQSSRYLFESEYKIAVDNNKVVSQRQKQHNSPRELLFKSSNVKVVGYFIEKVELKQDGTFVHHDPMIIENPGTTIHFDPKVKYGSKYIYSVRTMSIVSFSACDISTNSIQQIDLLMASRRSHSVLIKIEETIPPPPPADFMISWDYKEDAPRLTWAFPINPQRDVKRFQVFRRKTINEPFELIREFDFDNSIIKTPNPETPNEELVLTTGFPITHFIDKEFKRKHESFSFLKTDKFIYSVRCIDAHGMGSNYSTQFEVSFDNFKNKVIAKRVSASGAPMQYPNLFLLNRDTFIDAIKSSNKNRMKIYFDPDFYQVMDNDGRIVDVVRANDSKYKISIINLDFQDQANIDIKIEDRRN